MAWQGLAFHAVDEVAAWIMLIGLAVAAIGWYKHGLRQDALWRTTTGRDDKRTPNRIDRNGTEIS